ncbi:hypothetical protein ADIMK_2642 [Marinobacterium lacunae]|uniref:Flavin reductase like domain-containing protein n=2 Tax=Marinobacterium lacunae TaxID=1232683 RepID=A0A081FX63_9GAMM|nr:hypothetical protein ADIMK_2642 [Marinobacterium lacunae]
MAVFAMFQTSATLEAIRQTGRFAVHFVEYPNRSAAMHFASRSADKFNDDLEWEESQEGLPMLSGFNTCLSCRLVELRPAGDHDLVICAVEGVDLSDIQCEPTAWFMSSFHELQRPISLSH